MYVVRVKLRKHVKQVHTENRKFECDLCNVLFKTKTDLTIHNQIVHAINYILKKVFSVPFVRNLAHIRKMCRHMHDQDIEHKSILYHIILGISRVGPS